MIDSFIKEISSTLNIAREDRRITYNLGDTLLAKSRSSQKEVINILTLSGIKNWNSFRHWIENNFEPQNKTNPTIRHTFDIEAELELEKRLNDKSHIRIVNFEHEVGGSSLDFSRNIRDCLKNHNIQCELLKLKEEGEGAAEFPKKVFDIIDATPLLYCSDWRLGLTRLLRMLKPNGYLVFPYVEEDALLFDGEIAKWISKIRNPSEGKNEREINFLHKTFCWLFSEIERLCNRPWIPETGLSKPEAFCQLAKHVLDYDTHPNKALFSYAKPLNLKFKGGNLTKKLLEFLPFNALISPSEIPLIKKSLIEFQNNAASGERDFSFQLKYRWIAIQFPEDALTVNKINDAAILSLISGPRYLIDSEHHLLPEYEALESDKATDEDQKILRSLRGFVCRMLQHDRFDSENHHLFAATLWIPKKSNEKNKLYDLSEGEFTGVTGYVFRSKSSEADAKRDQALRNITYLAHATHNEITLQSIPQKLFKTDRPVIRVVLGDEKQPWDYEIRGYSQSDFSPSLDKSVEIDEILNSPMVPSEITFYLPNYDKKGIMWEKFKNEYLLKSLTDEQIFLTDKDASGVERTLFQKSVLDQLIEEHWETNIPSLYSFPWNLKRVKDKLARNDQDDVYPWFESTSPVSSGGVYIHRGEAAGYLTKNIVKLFDGYAYDNENKEKNLWTEFLFDNNPQKRLSQFLKFNEKIEELFRKIGLKNVAYTTIKDSERHQWFYALLALAFVFPVIERKEKWELRQIPIGSFINISEQKKEDKEKISGEKITINELERQYIKKFVAAGSALLISKMRSEENTISKDVALRQDLAEIRSSQLLRRVPSVLLPLSMLVYARILREETVNSQTEEIRANVASGLVHNLRNLISPVTVSRSLLQEEIDNIHKNESKINIIDKLEEKPWWNEAKDSLIGLNFLGFRNDLFNKFLKTIEETLSFGVSSESAIKDTLNAYYEFLSNTYQGNTQFQEVFTKVTKTVWEMWADSSLEWFTTFEAKEKNWNLTKEKLKELRKSEREQNKSWSFNENNYWLIPDRAKINFRSTIPSGQLIPYPSMVFHIFLELIWNGVKHLAEETFLSDKTEEIFNLSFDADIIDEEIQITYSQTVINKDRREYLKNILEEAKTDITNFRGIKAIPVLVKKSGWKLKFRVKERDIVLVFRRKL